MDENIRKIILNEVEKYNYKTVILFGSRARKDYNSNSDYDLLIIMKEELEITQLRKIQMEIRKKLALQNIDADVLVKTQQMIEEYREKKGNVIYNALREGVTI